MIPALLEHFFTTRGLWYRGPKVSLKYLKSEQPEIYSAFKAAIKVGAGIGELERLVKSVELAP
jgi:hypothetical protein